jgi:hypothetical protein
MCETNSEANQSKVYLCERLSLLRVPHMWQKVQYRVCVDD